MRNQAQLKKALDSYKQTHAEVAENKGVLPQLQAARTLTQARIAVYGGKLRK